MKERDENLSELEFKSFWYKPCTKSICTKMNLVISFSVINSYQFNMAILPLKFTQAQQELQGDNKDLRMTAELPWN